jgi:hypothetical protein
VPDRNFLFALEMSDTADAGRMLGELCSAVLGHVGYAAPAIAELTTAMAAAVTAGGAAGRRRCDVRFVADGDALQISVACAGGAAWHATRPLPPS